MKEKKVLRHKLSRQFRHKQNKLGIEKLERHLDNVGGGGHTRKAKLKLGKRQFGANIEHQQQGV